MLEEARVREIQEAGLELVADSVPSSAPSTDSVLARLAGILRFRRDKVGWAYLDGDAIRALGDGAWTAWMIVVPEHHRLIKEQMTIFRARADWGPNVVLIKPVAMSRVWAGLGQVHECSHLYDLATGAEPPQPDQAEWSQGEVRAYVAEIALANLVARGAYSTAVTATARSLGLREPRDVLGLVRGNSPELAGLASSLDPIISTARPESEEEEGLRLGLHIVALGFSLAESGSGMSHQEFVRGLMGADPSRFLDLPPGG